jgi:nucleoside-diphosphate-sugar epimerase
MPSWAPAGYLLGKTQASEYVRGFVAALPSRSATILQPGAIYGTRHTAGGTAVPLWALMQPVSILHRFLGTPLSALANTFPKAFKGVADAPFVDVAKVASVAVKAATAPAPFPGAPLDVRCRTISNAEILEELLPSPDDETRRKNMTKAT